MKAAAKAAFGSGDLFGKKIAVQGVGHVAYSLCSYLHEEKANIIVTDINAEAVERAVQAFGAESVEPDDIYDVDCDIFTPCALGGGINDDTISRLKAKVIAGSANNQLLEERHGKVLHDKGIIYAPDYVINSGGVINVVEEMKGYDEDSVLNKVETIYTALERVFDISKEKDIPTAQAANNMAENRIKVLQQVRKTFIPHNKNVIE